MQLCIRPRLDEVPELLLAELKLDRCKLAAKQLVTQPHAIRSSANSAISFDSGILRAKGFRPTPTDVPALLVLFAIGFTTEPLDLFFDV